MCHLLKIIYLQSACLSIPITRLLADAHDIVFVASLINRITTPITPSIAASSFTFILGNWECKRDSNLVRFKRANAASETINTATIVIKKFIINVKYQALLAFEFFFKPPLQNSVP